MRILSAVALIVLTSPAFAGVSFDLPRLTYPEPTTTLSTNGCLPAQTTVCTPRH
jgi:hypothetical protein